jgi:peroxiredoxin
MDKQSRLWIRTVLLVIMLGMLGFALYQVTIGKEKGKPEVGQQAPDFELTDLQGKKVRLSDFRGKAVMLNFWGSWCEPCRSEMPALQAAYEKYKDQGFVVIAVNIAEADVTAAAFAKDYGLTFPIWLDRNRDVVRQYQIGPIPTSFFIDPNGKIVNKVEGPLDLTRLESYILPILPKK